MLVHALFIFTTPSRTTRILASPHHHFIYIITWKCICACSVFATHYCRNFPFLDHPENRENFCLSSLSSSLEDVRKKRARKPLRRKSIKGFFSEATFHIHKFSTFSPLACLCYAVLLNFFLPSPCPHRFPPDCFILHPSCCLPLTTLDSVFFFVKN